MIQEEDKDRSNTENGALSELESNVETCSGSTVHDSHTEKVAVFCVATLDNCPNDVLDQEYASSIRKCLFDEQHLLDNVHSSKFDHISCRSFRNKKFVHTITIKLMVKKSRIKESPVEYVKKHLG